MKWFPVAATASLATVALTTALLQACATPAMSAAASTAARPVVAAAVSPHAHPARTLAASRSPRSWGLPSATRCLDEAPGATKRENARRGSTAWQAQALPVLADGYASADSVTCGGSVRVFVGASAPSFRLQAWRLGYYAGTGARLIWTSPSVASLAQPRMHVESRTGTARADWTSTLTVHVGHDWPAGQYLLRIVPSVGANRGGYIPLTVRDPAAHRRAVLLMATATYEAYNGWGGLSAYRGPHHLETTRARVVTFDRPYYGPGDGQLLHNDYPLLRWLESKGIDTAYVTTEDADAAAPELGYAAVVMSGTHSEYISGPARAALEKVLARGGNLAFFGANEMYWRPRYAATGNGSRRDLVIYKDAKEDPQGRSAALSSTRWRDAPIAKPENALLGSMFDCLGAHLDEPLVVNGANTWLFRGTGLADGARLEHFITGEIDRTWADPQQGPVVVLNRTWFPCPARGGISRHDIVVRATPAGGAVFNAGTFGWVCHLAASCAVDPGNLRMQQILDRMTMNVLLPMLAGPAGQLASGAVEPTNPVRPPTAGPTPGPAPTTTTADPATTTATPDTSTTPADTTTPADATTPGAGTTTTMSTADPTTATATSATTGDATQASLPAGEHARPDLLAGIGVLARYLGQLMEPSPFIGTSDDD